MLIYLLIGYCVIAIILYTEVGSGNAEYNEAWTEFKETAKGFIKTHTRDLNDWTVARNWILGIGGVVLIFTAVAFLWPVAILVRVYQFIEHLVTRED